LITLVCIDFSKKKAVAWPASVRSRIESLMVI